jgi:tetratricopeptide (TPR) repeat protein
METMEQAYSEIARLRRIARVAGDEGVKALVRQYLGTEIAGPWLLIVDNADDMDILFGNETTHGIADYLPNSESGLILFTTRHQKMAVSLANNDVIEIQKMDTREATSFLEKSLIRKNLLSNDQTANVIELLEELTYLPLAITQAAAYLNTNKNVSILQYLQLMRTTEQNLISLMSQEFRDNTRYTKSANAVANTWLVSFDQIHKDDAVAADLLLFMAHIEPKGVPRSILPPSELDEQLVRAIGTLCAYSFIVQRGDEDVYDVHRLIQLATRIWAEEHHIITETMEKAIRHVSNTLPYAEYDNRTVWREYLPHALRLLSIQQSEHIRVNERYTLCFKIGRCFYEDRRIKEAIRWIEECYKWRENNLSEDDSDRLSSQHALAIAYRTDGQVDKALKLLEQVVAVSARVLREDHPNRLASQHALAISYQADGQVDKAVKLLEQVVAVEAKMLREDHPDRLVSQHTLAIAYQMDGQVNKAMKLLEQVVAVKAKVLREDHSSRLASQQELAMAYAADGQVDKAIKLLEQVVAVKAKVFREDHPDRLSSQHALAMAYEADGQVDKALKLLEQIVAIEAKVLRDDHPSRIMSQTALSRVLHKVEMNPSR